VSNEFAWDQVVRAERSYAEALAELSVADLSQVVGPALKTPAERRTALRVLRDCEPALTEEVFPQLSSLLLVSHSLLEECRRLVLRIDSLDLTSLLGQLVEQVVDDPDADYETFRRLAELLKRSGDSVVLAELLGHAANSRDPDIREVAIEFTYDDT